MKDVLFYTRNELRNHTTSGKFIERDNLHLTLVFIGETNQEEVIKQAMEDAVKNTNATPFQISMRGLGRFKRPEGDIYWVGVEKEDTLWRLQQELTTELKNRGLNIEDREYKPHLTLGRKVRVEKNFNKEEIENNMLPTMMEVAKISLMKSERVQGNMVYTEIYEVPLKENKV